MVLPLSCNNRLVPMGSLFVAVIVLLSVAINGIRFPSDISGDDEPSMITQELVDHVNSHTNLWRASLDTPLRRYSNQALRRMLGVKRVQLTDDERRNNPAPKIAYVNIAIPTSFDSRNTWPNCTSIRTIRDQSDCGSCWAFGAVEAMSDRICIVSGGTTQVSLSADDLLSCCSSCGSGCNGGNALSAWQYWVSDGIVTGSNYALKQGCRPYPLPPCEHHTNASHYHPCPERVYPTPACKKQCVANYTAKSYQNDKHYGASAYAVNPTVENIQMEISTHGPVEALFTVYTDFLTYYGGIYHHTYGAMEGGHAVKLIGWGVENGVSYWLAANSWNSDWGENGFFRIVRGTDECGIEDNVIAGLPKLQ